MRSSFSKVFRMQFRIFRHPIALALGFVASFHALGEVSVAGIETRYVPDARLSAAELRQVVELAHECGISHVGQIASQSVLPNGGFSFNVKSVETVRGRNVSYLSLCVNHRKWIRPRDASEVRSVGSFWSSPESVTKEELTTFPFRGRTIRVRLAPEVDLATADNIVKAIASRSIRYRDAGMKGYLKGFDASGLRVILCELEDYTFTAISLDGTTLRVKVKDAEVTIVGVGFGML
jgi:hypothetical protein